MRKNPNWISALEREKYDALRRAAMARTLPNRTDLSFADRLKFAVLRLIHETSDDSQIQDWTGRSMKQLGRYIEGNDLPLSVLISISKYSGVPLGWLLENQGSKELYSGFPDQDAGGAGDELDQDLLRGVIGAVLRASAETGAILQEEDLGVLAADAYREIADAAGDRSERQIMLKLASNQLRKRIEERGGKPE